MEKQENMKIFFIFEKTEIQIEKNRTNLKKGNSADPGCEPFRVFVVKPISVSEKNLSGFSEVTETCLRSF